MFKLVLISALLAISLAEPRPKSDSSQTVNSLVDDKAQDKISAFPTGDDASKDSQFASTQVLENPAYDPAIYQSFIPQDAVQQYVSQFASPYAVYPGVNPGGFAVQTGYEGYLVPAIAEQEDTSLAATGISILQNLLGKSLLGWLVHIATYVASGFGLLFFGGAVTTALCHFTPLCSISFAALPFFSLQKSAQDITKTLSTEITPDRVRRTAELVQEAIAKYTEMQKQFGLSEDPDTNVQKIEKDSSDKDL